MTLGWSRLAPVVAVLVLLCGSSLFASDSEAREPSQGQLVADTFTALLSETVGVGADGSLASVASRSVVFPPASYALVIDGHFKLGGVVFKDGAPFLHADGGPSAGNTAIGWAALSLATPGVPGYGSGSWNTAVGSQALQYNSTGGSNTAVGRKALWKHQGGMNNTAIGDTALIFDTVGSQNTAVGAQTLGLNQGSNNTAVGFSAMSFSSSANGGNNTGVGAFSLQMAEGSNNTAVGVSALGSTTSGHGNIAVGASAGSSNSTGSNSIWIGATGSSESNTLRIGNGTGTADGKLAKAFISGIANAAGGSNFNQVVCVNTSTDQLGPCPIVPSSRRFKEEIEDMGEASAAVLDLRPVTFRFKAEGDGERPLQYGLIAEEVAELLPQLATYDAEGKPLTVRYEALTPLLLNELQRLRREIDELRGDPAVVGQVQGPAAEWQSALRAARTEVTELSARLEHLEREYACARDETASPPPWVARAADPPSLAGSR